MQGFFLNRVISGGSKRLLLNWTVFCVQSSSSTRCFSPATSVLTTTSYNSRPLLHPVRHQKQFAQPFISGGDLDKMSANRFAVDYARLGTSSCKKCKQKLVKGVLRLAKITASSKSEGKSEKKEFFHPECLFETFQRMTLTMKVIEKLEDVEGFHDLKNKDKDLINKLIKDHEKELPERATCWRPRPTSSTSSFSNIDATGASDAAEMDNSFIQFQKLCSDLSEERSDTGKTKIVETYITNGTTGDGFQGDLFLLLKLLLARDIKLVYNLNSKQLVKHFSQIFRMSVDEMVEDLEEGDAAQTVKTFFERSRTCPPQSTSTLSIQEVDEFLCELSGFTHEDDQQKCLAEIANRLDALHPDAYESFKASKNLKDVIDQVIQLRQTSRGTSVKKLSVQANVMTPVQPMLAEACKSVDQAFRKYPNGMFAEIKYDGERVQVHKRGDKFLYYSRSLKPVLSHKVEHFKDFIQQAFPYGEDMILDSEVLLIDTMTSKPLPFGTLGIHKKDEFKNTIVCLVVFDCLHFNGEDLMKKPLTDRRQMLEDNMVEQKNRILLSEMKLINGKDALNELMEEVFSEGLEGLVLKDVAGGYEPGKRHWLKVKKDYLAEGAMADSADLVLLGAYFGTGSRGGIMSKFLMGVYDSDTSTWCTVTKVGNGFDMETLKKLQKSLRMIKIERDHEVPLWLNVARALIPDFIAADPMKSLVWEISGASFSHSESHTAAGISIRFPRVTKFRDDKTWKEATDLKQLKELVAKSRDHSDVISKRAQRKKTQPPQNADKDNEDGSSDRSTQSGKRKAEQEPTGVSAKKRKK